VYIPICNIEVLLAAVYKSPDRTWNDADNNERLSLRSKSILASVLNAASPFWSTAFSKPSGEKLMHLFDLNEFEISASHCPTHYSFAGNGDVLDIVVHLNIRLSVVIVSDILDSDNLPKLFHILDHFKIRIYRKLLKNLHIGIRFKILLPN
jgi:hypothetical protein